MSATVTPPGAPAEGDAMDADEPEPARPPAPPAAPPKANPFAIMREASKKATAASKQPKLKPRPPGKQPKWALEWDGVKGEWLRDPSYEEPKGVLLLSRASRARA